MKKWTIGEVARQAGLRTSAIRYYESEGLLPEPQRVHGRRYYDETIFPVLTVLQIVRAAGFTIADLRLLFRKSEADSPPRQQWNHLAARKMTELDVQIEQAQQMKHLLQRGMECGCLRYEDCLLVEKHRHGKTASYC